MAAVISEGLGAKALEHTAYKPTREHVDGGAGKKGPGRHDCAGFVVVPGYRGLAWVSWFCLGSVFSFKDVNKISGL